MSMKELTLSENSVNYLDDHYNLDGEKFASKYECNFPIKVDNNFALSLNYKNQRGFCIGNKKQSTFFYSPTDKIEYKYRTRNTNTFGTFLKEKQKINTFPIVFNNTISLLNYSHARKSAWVNSSNIEIDSLVESKTAIFGNSYYNFFVTKNEIIIVSNNFQSARKIKLRNKIIKNVEIGTKEENKISLVINTNLGVCIFDVSIPRFAFKDKKFFFGDYEASINSDNEIFLFENQSCKYIKLGHYTYSSNQKNLKYYPVCLKNDASFFSKTQSIPFGKDPELQFNIESMLFQRVREFTMEEFPVNAKIEKIDLGEEIFEMRQIDLECDDIKFPFYKPRNKRKF
jgi:hypothetical protein